MNCLFCSDFSEYAVENDIGGAVGTELASIGVNLNFAPVLDIDSNPRNPVIAARSFGTTAEAVTAKALPFIGRMEGSGVRDCGKHFPGRYSRSRTRPCNL